MSRMEQAQAQAAAPAPAAKHMPNDEASTHHIEDVRSTTSTTRTTSSTARASSARYMTARGGASARFRAMTERDEEAEGVLPHHCARHRPLLPFRARHDCTMASSVPCSMRRDRLGSVSHAVPLAFLLPLVLLMKVAPPLARSRRAVDYACGAGTRPGRGARLGGRIQGCNQDSTGRGTRGCEAWSR